MEVVLGVLVILELIVIGVLLFFVWKRQRAMNTIMDITNQIAGKNVDVDDIELKVGTPDMMQLAKSLNIIKRNIKGLLEATKGNVITLSDAITELSRVAKKNEMGSEETANSIQVVAQKTGEQLELVRDNLNLIEANNDQLYHINQFVQIIQGSLSNSVSVCSKGMVDLELYEKDMNSISDNLNKCTGVLAEFNQQIDEINSIKELVVDISEQLRMLAFNASIESARVGELGKGFSVVAQEMKNMSDQTNDAMESINGVLEKIANSSELVTQSIGECDEAFNRNFTVFKNVSSTFREISQQSADVNQKMEDITGKYRMITNNSNQSRIKAENVFTASEVISESTANIANISEDNKQNSSSLSGNVQMLENMLMRINSIISQFNTGVKPVNKNRAKKVKIAYFSPLDNFFWYGIRSGVNYAQKELANNNVEIRYNYYETNADEVRFPGDVRKCISDDFDAIIYPGFMHGADKEMKEAAAKGIKIFTFNCDCDKDIDRVSCYEPDEYESGELAAKAMIKTLHKKGRIAIVVGERVVAVNQIRYDGFVEYLKNNCKDIVITDTVEVDNVPESAYKKIYDMLKRNPDIDGVYCTAGMQIQLVKAIKDLGRKGTLKAVVFDKNQDIFGYIKEGIVAATIDHDPFTQGYYPIVLMYNHLVDGFKLDHERTTCPASVVDSDNVDEYVNV